MARIALQPAGADPLQITLASISDQLTLAAIDLPVPSVTSGAAVSWSWTIVGPGGDETANVIASSNVQDAGNLDPSAAAGGSGGEWTVIVTATDASGNTATAAQSFSVGSPQRFHRLLAADFREAHTISGDGPVTIGGVSVNFANTASASITVDATNGIDITRTGGSSPTATVDLDAALTALSHTINPSVAGREYLFVVWGTATAGGSIAAWVIQDSSDAAPQFRFGDGVASDLYMQTATGVAGTFTEAAVGNVWVLRLKDTVAELYVGTATQGSWDYDLSDLTRTQGRVWGNSHAANVSAPAWSASNFEILSGHSAVNDRTQWRGLDVLVRDL